MSTTPTLEPPAVTTATPESTSATPAERIDRLEAQVNTIMEVFKRPAKPESASDVWYYSRATGTWALANPVTIPDKLTKGKAQRDQDRGYWIDVRRHTSPEVLLEGLNWLSTRFAEHDPVVKLADHLLDLVGGKKRGTVIEKLEQVYRLVRDEISWMDEVESQVRNRPKGR